LYFGKGKFGGKKFTLQKNLLCKGVFAKDYYGGSLEVTKIFRTFSGYISGKGVGSY
jgi:hypothetical protein